MDPSYWINEIPVVSFDYLINKNERLSIPWTENWWKQNKNLDLQPGKPSNKKFEPYPRKLIDLVAILDLFGFEKTKRNSWPTSMKTLIFWILIKSKNVLPALLDLSYLIEKLQ